MFFSLVLRLPAYDGVMAARLAKENGPSQQRQRGQGPASYDRGSGQANVAATASSAPPATRGQLMALNSQLGGNFFSHAVVSKSG